MQISPRYSAWVNAIRRSSCSPWCLLPHHRTQCEDISSISLCTQKICSFRKVSVSPNVASTKYLAYSWHVFLGIYILGFPGSMVKNPPANAGDAGLIPGEGRSPGEGNGHPVPIFLPGKSHGQRSLVG